MIYGIFVFFHITACVVLIAVILLQSGRGGGLSEMAGGGVQQTQKLFGTQTNALLMKFTSYCAIAFLITSISLVLLTSRRSRSLMEGARIQPIFDTTTPEGQVDQKALEDAVKALTAKAEETKAAADQVAATAEKTAGEAARKAEAAGVAATTPAAPSETPQP